MKSLAILQSTIKRCHMCPRLVRWREQASKDPPRRYRGERYWAKPIPGFGDPRAGLLVVGLAPAAHGGNRTGRVFTGDRSGDWLYGALHKYGFANQPNSDHLKDGLHLSNCYVTAAVRCAPPANKPLREEFDNCQPYLAQEILLLREVRVVIALGKIAFDSYLKAYWDNGGTRLKPRPGFGHGATVQLNGNLTLLASYHPSQQNTFTGKLTREMFHGIFDRAKKILAKR